MRRIADIVISRSPHITLTAPHGELLVGWTHWHEERALPALYALLDLPVERLIRLSRRAGAQSH